MTVSTEVRNRSVKSLLNGTNTVLKSIVPIHYQMEKPQLAGKSLRLQFGVIIGFTGDVRGQLILAGETVTFGKVGEKMFGMPLEGEMLTSFSGELGNMLAGGLATEVAKEGITTDITSPTIIKGDTNLSGYNNGIRMCALFDDVGALDIYLLLD